LALKYKVPNKNLTSPITCDPRKQYSQQESAKLRQQIQMLQNSNRHLMRDSLSSLTVKELKQLENRLEYTFSISEIEFLQKREAELANESVCLRSNQANTAIGQDLNAIHELAFWNFFGAAIIEGGGSAYSHPDKKILHLG
ncbi:hypothetical protein CISIN_1g042511mg, partial [Citrus sinensis]